MLGLQFGQKLNFQQLDPVMRENIADLWELINASVEGDGRRRPPALPIVGVTANGRVETEMVKESRLGLDQRAKRLAASLEKQVQRGSGETFVAQLTEIVAQLGAHEHAKKVSSLLAAVATAAKRVKAAKKLGGPLSIKGPPTTEVQEPTDPGDVPAWEWVVPNDARAFAWVVQRIRHIAGVGGDIANGDERRGLGGAPTPRTPDPSRPSLEDVEADSGNVFKYKGISPPWLLDFGKRPKNTENLDRVVAWMQYLPGLIPENRFEGVNTLAKLDALRPPKPCEFLFMQGVTAGLLATAIALLLYGCRCCRTCCVRDTLEDLDTERRKFQEKGRGAKGAPSDPRTTSHQSNPRASANVQTVAVPDHVPRFAQPEPLPAIARQHSDHSDQIVSETGEDTRLLDGSQPVDGEGLRRRSGGSGDNRRQRGRAA